MSLPSFADFVARHQYEIKTVQAMLATKLSDAPGEAEEQGREAESWFGRMTTLEAWAKSYVEEARNEVLKILVRTEKMTALEKEIAMDSGVAVQTRFYGVVKGLVESLKIRVSFVQSLIKSESLNRGRMAT